MSITTTSVRHGIASQIDLIAALCETCQLEELSIFGAVMRDDFDPECELDSLVDIMKPGNLSESEEDSHEDVDQPVRRPGRVRHRRRCRG